MRPIINSDGTEQGDGMAAMLPLQREALIRQQGSLDESIKALSKQCGWSKTDCKDVRTALITMLVSGRVCKEEFVRVVERIPGIVAKLERITGLSRKAITSSLEDETLSPESVHKAVKDSVIGPFETEDSAQAFISNYDWVGKSLRVFFQENNPNNKLLHLRGETDGLLVARSWSRRKQSWHYEVIDIYYLVGFNRFLTVENTAAAHLEPS